MCGLTGFLTQQTRPQPELRAALARMTATLTHRGPDSEGLWLEGGMALGHRRLAIVDLSPAGHQPMASRCGRYVLAFNGEIYNHLELRRELPAQDWRGHSDTETLLAAVARWGLQGTLPRLVGMFAIALWDREQQTLQLARDRLGEKPLYYGQLPGGDFVFGSELKALREHPDWQAAVDRSALALYMRHNVVPGTHCIYQGLHKLAPAHWLSLRAGQAPQTGCYWDLPAIAAAGQRAWAPEDAVQRLGELLDQALRGQRVADVPLGAFLSGGVDSSTVVARLQALSERPVHSFAIGFEQAHLNEAEHAQAVAAHLGTRHTEFYVSSADALALIPQLPQLYDEPFADSSQIPTHLVARLAQREVRVALSGDGGDELFAGYNRYVLAAKVWRHLARLPLGLRRWAARCVLSQPPARLDRLGRWIGRANLGDRLHKAAEAVLPAVDAMAMYRALVSHWPDPGALVLGAQEGASWLDPGRLPALPEAVDRMALADQMTYLPDDILVKVDRAAMAVGLETRVPLLDHRIVEFAWQLPLDLKLREGQSKWVLRQLLYRQVPRTLIDRPKQGFAVPLDAWLRGPLRDWAEALLEPTRLHHTGLLDAERVQRHWQEHLSGRRNWQYRLWDVLMFQAWHERWMR
ncbi:asparagine synthase (glutamine-hydrolyzing) [Inhella proteolytica]|uniref:asparagine synthase (glutamine-hydrolyzing) n=1 Tax=Inhella proteolytica TaxID=2795029 RepID=A0A931J4D9_9BURK|nr:asparagine synthase (glutamine-hydrolyzing) [Inhella proteolytica]MBH9578005.1 asparagine synthase (glutamine-hydrolyzing) [Inhella proteolytica]